MFAQPQSCAFGNNIFSNPFIQNPFVGLNQYGLSPFGLNPQIGGVYSGLPINSTQQVIPQILPQSSFFGMPFYHQRPSLLEMSSWNTPAQPFPFFGQPPFSQIGLPNVNPFLTQFAGSPFAALPQIPINTQLNPLPFLSQQPGMVDPRLSQFANTSVPSPVATSSTGVH